jgi:hypothetical protein
MTSINARTVLLVTAIVGAAGGVYAATTTTNTPGAACVAVGSGTLNVRSDGEAENPTAATVTAVCPAERPAGADLTTKVSGQVFVVDQSTIANVCCKVVSKNAGGASVQSATICSAGASSGYQALSLPEITDPFSFSHFYVQCDVPPVSAGLTSRIQMYRTTQL